MTKTSLSEDLELIVESARAGGEIVLKFYQSSPRTWDKGNDNPVTEADLAVDALLQERLRSARTDYGWLSEESEHSHDRMETARTFVVDPIDGTRAFIKGKPEFAVCIAVVEHGRPVAGVVYNPVTAEMFTAVLGGGAHLNGTSITVRDRDRIEGCRMLANRRFLASERWRRAWPKMEIMMPNSIAYRMALVAQGAFHASVTFSRKSDWDIAAAELLVAEAGGISTTSEGAAFLYNRQSSEHPNVITAGPTLHTLLLEKAIDLGPRAQ